MTNYVVYNPDTGEILRAGRCQAPDLELQGEHVIADVGQDDTHYVWNGAVVEKSPGLAYLEKTEIEAGDDAGIMIAGYPVSAKIEIKGPVSYSGPLESSEDFLIFEIPGTYVICVTSIEQVGQEFTINVH